MLFVVIFFIAVLILPLIIFLRTLDIKRMVNKQKPIMPFIMSDNIKKSKKTYIFIFRMYSVFCFILTAASLVVAFLATVISLGNQFFENVLTYCVMGQMILIIIFIIILHILLHKNFKKDTTNNGIEDSNSQRK